MEIKRNIFQSSARMPKKYEPVATAMVQEDTDNPQLVGHMKTDHHILHARSPRVGEK
jgi:hypothetical protein